ncbi:MAG TPA: response regulator [Steroidobacteraceae bacterium]|nr:response regulator [Steroidobacteraceae bacterium]
MNASPSILLAEDDEGHATLIRRNLRRAGFNEAPVHLKDGQELLDYVYRREPWKDRTIHDSLAIIADLNMPRLGGFEVLQRLKQDERLSRIPVFVLTTTDNPTELDRCYALGAAGYFVKPVDYGVFAELVRHLADFLTSVRLPSEAPSLTHGS